MPEGLGLAQEAGPSTDRRQHARQRPRTLTYAELDRENGGIVLDASETGLSVHAVVPLTDDVLPQLRLKLPETNSCLETRARVVWTRESGKVAGLHFEELPEAARTQIREWLSKEASVSDAGSAYPETPSEKRRRRVEERQLAPEVNRSHLGAADSRSTTASTSALGMAPPNFKIAAEGVAGVQSAAVTIDARGNDRPPAPVKQGRVPNLLAEEPRRNTSIYLLFVALAVISLSSGWAAGRGKFGPMVARFKTFLGSVAPQDLPSNVKASDTPSAPVSDIEIVDVNGQRRTISLTRTYKESLPATPKPSGPGSATTNAPASDTQPGLNFQIWTLASPQRSAASQNSSAMRGSAPPVVEGNNPAPDLSPVGGSAIDAPNPDALPKPQTRTGVLKRGELIHRVEPEYPDIAREQGISGTVTLEATVGANGSVLEVRVINGPKLLVRSAVDAVRQWRYTPTLLDGKAIETQVDISLVFASPSSR